MAALRLAPVLAALALLAAGTVSPAAASASTSTASSDSAGITAESEVDDFSYAVWDAQYALSLDDDGRSIVHVTETLTARFPESDQNRGIVRGLETTYRDAWLETSILSVTDEDGEDIPYETDEEEGLLYILTGDDDFVHGLTTYVIEYEMRDVVLAADTGVDEFYWDLLPFASTQPIESFRAEVLLDDAVSARLTGDSRCYQGQAGATTECTLTRDGAVFRVSADDLAAGEGITIAIGLEAGTAVQPEAREPNPVTDIVPAAAAVGALGLTVGSWFAVGSFRRRRRTATGIIVAQYEVPDDLPPLIAAAIGPGKDDPVPAEIVHLAVRGALRIEEGESEEEPRLRRLPDTRLPDPLDDVAMASLFEEADGDVIDLPATSEEFAEKMDALEATGPTAAAERGLTTSARSRGAMVMLWCAIAIAVGGFVLGLIGIIAGRPTAIPAFVAICFGIGLVLLGGLYSFSKHTVLTPDGARAYEHLAGVKEFIRVAEADRLRMLQSYSGADRRSDGSADVIVVYERLLPYAMLFGQEQEWGTVLENAYAQEQRGAAWLGDPHSPLIGARIAAFVATSQAAVSYASPSDNASSASGGSFGGGFAGGGGGGGFSGGR